jgi:hypothetical protein
MKKGLITFGLGFLLAFIGAEGGVPFLAMVGGVGMVAGCVMVGWNLDLGSKSSGKSSPTPRPVPPKPAPKPEPLQPTPHPAPEPAKRVGKFCRNCGAKVEPDDIYCVECGYKI